jgi:hypothetical protein
MNYKSLLITFVVLHFVSCKNEEPEVSIDREHNIKKSKIVDQATFDWVKNFAYHHGVTLTEDEIKDIIVKSYTCENERNIAATKSFDKATLLLMSLEPKKLSEGLLILKEIKLKHPDWESELVNTYISSVSQNLESIKGSPDPQ